MALVAELDTFSGWIAQRVKLHPGALAGYKRLAGAVVIQACRDARGDTLEAYQARRWLKSQEAELYFEILGLSRAAVRRWLAGGMTIPKRRKQ